MKEFQRDHSVPKMKKLVRLDGGKVVEREYLWSEIQLKQGNVWDIPFH